ncbi:hypothetical protein ACFXOY_08765 [Streptomyces niveus]|uniref:hypothetical protein n=1 Tax=Streptomyces niveus TaxID=193462 RepID=UPI00367F34ED
MLPHAGDWHEAGLMAAAERYRHPLHATPGSGPRDTPPDSPPGLSVEGARRVGLLGADDTRTTAPDAEPGTVRIPLRAWEIATVRLTGGSAGPGTTEFPARR